MEMLRKQISVYASISESLLHTHKLISDLPLPGMGPSNSCNGPYFTCSFNRIPSRQRWSPAPDQLHQLESIYNQSSSTPHRQKIREITNQLSLYGPISETNVYNWFQNRRARSKRKRPASASESDHEVEVETVPVPVPATNKKSKPDDSQFDDNLALMLNYMFFQSPDIGGIDQLIGNAAGVSYNL